MGKLFRLPKPVARIYRAINELESTYGRKFTLDGHLAGSIGEVVAAKALRLKLHRMSYKGHDARDARGRHYQIKLTAGSKVAMYATCRRLVVLRVLSNKKFAELVYNGPGDRAWKLAGKRQKNGQKSISVSRLRKLMGPARAGH